jgi:hypothetical protein
MADGPSLVLGAWSPETLEGLAAGLVDADWRNGNVSSPLIADRDFR